MIHNKEEHQQTLSELLMELLVCPACKGDLDLKPHHGDPALICPSCQLVFPINDGIPVMLIDQAVPWNE